VKGGNSPADPHSPAEPGNTGLTPFAASNAVLPAPTIRAGYVCHARRSRSSEHGVCRPQPDRHIRVDIGACKYSAAERSEHASAYLALIGVPRLPCFPRVTGAPWLTCGGGVGGFTR